MQPLWNRDGSLRQFAVYVMSNSSMTLYVGVTNDLQKRARAHKCGEGSSFTKRYHFDRLVYYELYANIRPAIEREKQIKVWTRSKKIALIKTMNPEWKDLSDERGFSE